jgi:hypothetical protein
MAHKDIIETTDPAVNAMDNAAHEKTYAGFTSLVKWSIIAMAVLVIVLYFWINP